MCVSVCDKRAVAALISAAYRAPRLSLCVRRNLTLSLKVHRLVKRRNPWIAALFQGLRCFSCENAAHFAELWCVSKIRSTFGKKRCNILPAQIQRQPVKVRCISYQKTAHKFFISVTFFLTYTVHVCLTFTGLCFVVGEHALEKQ